MPNDKILIVDDEGADCRLLTQWLGPLGYAIELASNGEEAVQKSRNSRPDMIIIDSMMPVRDNHKARRILKAAPETKDIPIIRVLCRQDRKSDGHADGSYRDENRCKSAA
ncbi:MAG: response regulator [Nitrospirae bacterium]|nr:response regulator [Nitrospirota bacterium]